MYIFRLILVLLLFLFVSIGANAQCSYSDPTACGSPGVNNIAVGGIINGGNGSSVRVTSAGGGSAQTLATWANAIPTPIVAPTNGSDAAAAIRAAACSNCKVVLPPGTYTFSTTVSSPYSYNDPPAVLWQNQSNFILDMSAATINVSNAISFSCAFMFDTDSNYKVILPNIVGSRSGLTSLQENVGVCTHSAVNYQYIGGTFSGFGGQGAAFNGDWGVNGVFDNPIMEGVGICFDQAFLKSVTFRNFRGYGADTNGASGANQIGSKCFSLIYDTPGENDNHTGYTYTSSDGVTAEGSSATNFDIGVYIASGNNYTLTGNHWYANVGCPTVTGTCVAALAGYGIYIDYIPSGDETSVGNPPSNIAIVGDTISGNGNSTEGGVGIALGSNNISNSDIIGGITVNAVFNNNYTEGMEATSSSHLGNIVVGGVFSGSNQTSWVGSNLAGSTPTPSALVASYQGTAGTSIFANNMNASGAIAPSGTNSIVFQSSPSGTPANYVCTTSSGKQVVSASPC